LRTEVVDHDLNRTDVGFNRRYSLFNAVRLDGVKQISRRRAAFILDALYQFFQPGFVSAPTQARVIALLRKAPGNISANACTGTND
jgi:hypothetical protein